GAVSTDARNGGIAAVVARTAGLVDVRATWRSPALAVGAKAGAAINPCRAVGAIGAARVERSERAMVARAELLAGHVEGGMARVCRVRAAGRQVDGGPPELPLQALVAIVPEGVEEDPEVPSCRHGRDGRVVVVVQILGSEREVGLAG